MDCKTIVNAKPLPHEAQGLITLFDSADGVPFEVYIYASADVMYSFPIINGNQIQVDPPNNCFFSMFNSCCYEIVVVDEQGDVLNVTQNDITGDTIKLCFIDKCTDENTHEIKFLTPPECEDKEKICLC